jgi:hypothetical protein
MKKILWGIIAIIITCPLFSVTLNDLDAADRQAVIEALMEYFNEPSAEVIESMEGEAYYIDEVTTNYIIVKVGDEYIIIPKNQ